MEALAWIGTALAIAGAAVIAANIGRVLLGYWLFLGSNVLWLVVGIAGSLWALAAMQVVFGVINVIGLLRWRRPVPVVTP